MEFQTDQRERTRFTCQMLGIPEDQEGLVLEKGGKRMVLDPSHREFAIGDMCSKKCGQLGPRVHLMPKSEDGDAFM
eukprot:1104902-Karenia_brevis.AAC.1